MRLILILLFVCSILSAQTYEVQQPCPTSGGHTILVDNSYSGSSSSVMVAGRNCNTTPAWVNLDSTDTYVLDFATSLNAIDWGSNQTSNKNFDVSFKFRPNAFTDVTHFMPFCSATATHYMLFDDAGHIVLRLAGTSKDLTGTNYARRWNRFAYGMLEWRFVKSGTTLTTYINDQLWFTETIIDTAFVWRYFGRWSTNNSYDFRGKLEWVKIDGVTYNAANSWGGKTLTNVTADTLNYYEHQQSFMVLGQSNAVGRSGQAANASQGITFPFANTWYYKDSETAFKEIAFPINQGADTAGNWGVEFRIAKTMSALGAKTYTIKYAVGGIAIAVWTQLNANAYIRQACMMAGKAGPRVIKNIIWIQGESDADNLTEANAYQAELTNLITYARMHLTNGEDTRFIIVRLYDFPDPTQQYFATIQAAQDAVAAAMDNVYIVTPPAGAMGLIDDTHYNAASIDYLARQIYLVMQHE